MDNLSPEVLDQILIHCKSSLTLTRLSVVSKKLNAMSDSDHYWKYLLSKDWKIENFKHCKSMYEACVLFERKSFGTSTINKAIKKKKLDLSFSRLKKIPRQIMLFREMTELCFHFNYSLEEISPCIRYLDKLENLHLFKNAVSTIPKELCSVYSLKILDLGKNFVIKIPKEIKFLTNLTDLSLYDNEELKVFPKYLLNVVSLRKLNLESTNMESGIPEMITMLSNLVDLNIRDNDILFLPDNIGDLTNLEKLNLKLNKLKYIPKSITKLVNLTDLDLGVALRCEVPEYLFKLTTLRKLDIMRNNIKVLSDNVTKLVNLEKINLSMNRLTALPETFFFELGKLQEVNLEHNHFASRFAFGRVKIIFE